MSHYARLAFDATDRTQGLQALDRGLEQAINVLQERNILYATRTEAMQRQADSGQSNAEGQLKAIGALLDSVGDSLSSMVMVMLIYKDSRKDLDAKLLS